MSLVVDIEALIEASEQSNLNGRHVEGAAQAERALAAAALSPAQRARTRALLAQHQLRLGGFEAAIRHGQLALDYYLDRDDRSAQSRLHSTLALAYHESKLDQHALRHLISALESARACADLHAECWALTRASLVYEALGDAERGMELGRQSLALARSLADTAAEFAALNNLSSNGLVLAAAQRARGDNPSAALHQALADGEEAVALARAQHNLHRETIARANLAEVLLRLERYAESRLQMQHAFVQASTEGYRGLALGIELDLAALLRAEGRADEALAHAQALLERIDPQQDPAMALSLHASLYEMLKARGDFASALQHHEQLHVLKLEEAEQTAGLQSRILLNRLELEEARHQVERSRHDAVMERRRAEELDREAHSDALTGLLNRRFIDRQLPHMIARAGERALPLAAVMIDIDHFKRVNDTHGHAVGDRVLAELATLLRQVTRGSDLAARLGGEEFLVVLVDTPRERAIEVCERLRAAVEAHAWATVAPAPACTISLGLSTLAPNESMVDWLARTDAALYAAKRGGRNRVVVATD